MNKLIKWKIKINLLGALPILIIVIWIAYCIFSGLKMASS